jgi:S1-C subfamily serine protease
VVIDDVFDPSPAAAAGVRVGDVLTAIDEQPIASVADFQRALYRAGIGARVTLHLARDAKILTRPVVVEERPATARPAG